MRFEQNFGKFTDGMPQGVVDADPNVRKWWRKTLALIQVTWQVCANDVCIGENNTVIVETSVFTRRVTKLLPDDEDRELQATLVDRPDTGSVIPGGGGLRKLRWSASGHGKRGGARIIYYWAVKQERILMLFTYAKNESGDLTPDQLKMLKQIMEKEYPW